MVSRGAIWTSRLGLRWFVRVAAICVALANVPVVVFWLVGGLSVLAGEGASLGEAFPSVLIAIVSGLATSQVVLRVFELPGRDFAHRYRIVLAAFCIGGAVMGELLGWLFVLDGTLGAGTFTTFLAEDLAVVLVNLVWALIPGFVGAVFGLVIGLAEGLVLALPLAAAVGTFRDG